MKLNALGKPWAWRDWQSLPRENITFCLKRTGKNEVEWIRSTLDRLTVVSYSEKTSLSLTPAVIIPYRFVAPRMRKAPNENIYTHTHTHSLSPPSLFLAFVLLVQRSLICPLPGRDAATVPKTRMFVLPRCVHLTSLFFFLTNLLSVLMFRPPGPECTCTDNGWRLSRLSVTGETPPGWHERALTKSLKRHVKPRRG